MTAGTTTLDVAAMRRMHEIIARIQQGQDLSSALQDVADGLHDILGLKNVCINFVEGDSLKVVALAGSDELRNKMVGTKAPLAEFRDLLAAADPMCGLSFMRDPRPIVSDLVYEEGPAEDMAGTATTWGALNMLAAPMLSTDGHMIGMVTADGHVGTALPDEMECTLMETLTIQAGMAIEKQQLTERLQREHALLRASEERFRLAFDEAPIGMCLLSLAGDEPTIMETNDALGQMFRADCDELVGRSILDLLPAREQETTAEQLGLLVSGQTHVVHGEVAYQKFDGTLAWCLVHTAVLPLRGPGQVTALCQIVDITAAKEAERTLTHLARHDPLTGLPNRRVLLDHLDDVVDRARKEGRTGAVLFCDLNHFKTVNDLHGHLVGDHVLAEVAARVSSAVRNTDLVGRLGGDEFVVVAHPLTLLEAEQTADRIAAALAEPVCVEQIETGVSASIGMVLITGALESIEVLRRADAAMYRGKHTNASGKYVIDTG